ncbi:uncharacterized protein LOC143916655 [Arctopsyche grandis]|uniref:uncharacterized protein LOC143916655 n=1 Tax=Arctopsyche grandis TaxID=121162 RepID=UPI00406D7974
MVRKLWMLFILTMATSAADDGLKYDDDKESRFLSLFAVTQGNPAPGVPGRPLPPRAFGSSARCATRLESALDQIKRRQMLKARNMDVPVQMIDLEGYSLHQHLRSAPVDMYVTRMRVRLPQNQNWVRVERCNFDPRNVSLETRLLFNDLTISGSVNLFEGHGDLGKVDDISKEDRDTFYENRDFRGDIYKRRDIDDRDQDFHRQRPNDPHERDRRDCNMILRLRKAGIGFYTQPLKQSPGRFSVKTDSEFIEPGFISVYAYGCERYISKNLRDYDRNGPDDDYKNNLDRRYKRQADTFRFDPNVREGRSYRDWDRRDMYRRVEKSKLFGPDDRLEDIDDISREMEDIFTKGIRTLLTTYMQKELQPAIKETLMRNLGFTISYG